jgi:NADH:ubiquinone oxidoreductase subunit E
MKNNILSEIKEYERNKGALDSEAFIQIAKRHGRSVAAVYSVSTYYSETSSSVRGKYKINLCQSLPCRMKGSEDILAVLQTMLHIDPEECTEDGMFSLHLVNCIGVCDRAPAMLVNGHLYGDLTQKEIQRLLEMFLREQPEVEE